MSMTGVEHKDPQIGDIVTSLWSSSGALWRIDGVHQYVDGRGRREVRITSLKSGRVDQRSSGDLRLVERPAS